MNAQVRWVTIMDKHAGPLRPFIRRDNAIGIIVRTLVGLTLSLTVGSVEADFLTHDGKRPAELSASSILIDQRTLSEVQPAVDAFKAGDLKKFEVAYRALAERLDSLPHQALFLAKLQIESGRADLALSNLELYVAQSPEDPEAYMALGEIALRSNRLTDAWLQFQQTQRLLDLGKLKASRLNLIQPGLMELMAETAERRGQFDIAQLHWDKLIALDPNRAYPLWRSGRLKVLKGDIEPGVAMMNTAFQKDTKLPCPELIAALCAAEKQDGPTAEKWFQTAIRANTSDPGRWVEYLKWLLINNRHEEVLKHIGKLQPELASNRTLRFIKGIAARYAGDLAAAEKEFGEIHRASPNDLEAADQLALVLVESADEGKRGRALQLSESNLRNAPKSEMTIATAAWVQFKLGDIDIADRMLGQLAAQTALAPQTAYYVSQVLKTRGKSDEANRVLQAAVESPGIFPARAAAKQQLKIVRP